MDEEFLEEMADDLQHNKRHARLFTENPFDVQDVDNGSDHTTGPHSTDQGPSGGNIDQLDTVKAASHEVEVKLLSLVPVTVGKINRLLISTGETVTSSSQRVFGHRNTILKILGVILLAILVGRIFHLDKLLKARHFTTPASNWSSIESDSHSQCYIGSQCPNAPLTTVAGLMGSTGHVEEQVTIPKTKSEPRKLGTLRNLAKASAEGIHDFVGNNLPDIATEFPTSSDDLPQDLVEGATHAKDYVAEKTQEFKDTSGDLLSSASHFVTEHLPGHGSSGAVDQESCSRQEGVAAASSSPNSAASLREKVVDAAAMAKDYVVGSAESITRSVKDKSRHFLHSSQGQSGGSMVGAAEASKIGADAAEVSGESSKQYIIDKASNANDFIENSAASIKEKVVDTVTKAKVKLGSPSDPVPVGTPGVPVPVGLSGRARQAKDYVLQSAEAAKDKIVQSATLAKDTIVSSASAAKEAILDSVTTSANKILGRQQAPALGAVNLQERAAKVKDYLVDSASVAKDKVIDSVGLVKEKILETESAAESKIAETFHGFVDTSREYLTKDLPNQAGRAKEFVLDTASSAKETLRNTAEAMQERILSSSHDFIEKSHDFLTDTIERGKSAKDFIVDKASLAKESVVDSASFAKEKIVASTSYARDSMPNFFGTNTKDKDGINENDDYLDNESDEVFGTPVQFMEADVPEVYYALKDYRMKQSGFGANNWTRPEFQQCQKSKVQQCQRGLTAG